jgi:hypothetical protein
VVSGVANKVRTSRRNFDRWLHELRTTPLAQCGQTLFDTGADGTITAACCLGIGTLLVPGVDARLSVGASFAPDNFAVWLGIPGASGVRYDEGVNLIVDWPEHLTLGYTEPHDDEHDSQFSPYSDAISAAELNDEWNLTFAQIADVFDYFGERGVEFEDGGHDG